MGTAFYPVVGEAVKSGHGSSTGGPRQALVKGTDEIALSLCGYSRPKQPPSYLASAGPPQHLHLGEQRTMGKNREAVCENLSRENGRRYCNTFL